MRPGLSRAVPFGILGFLLGMAIVTVIRSLQQIQPPMDPEIAIVLGAFTSAAAFVWGLGAFDPRMNIHAHEPADGEEEHALALADEDEAEIEAAPGTIVSSYIWLLSSLLLALLVVLVAFALLPEGPSLQTVDEPLSSVSAVGFVEIDLFGQVYQVSQLILLMAFVVFMFVSLAIFGGGVGLIFFGLNQGVTQVKEVEHTVFEAELLDNVDTSNTRSMARWGVVAAIVTVGFALLDRLIGNPITNEFETLSFFLSAACVFTVTFIALGYIIRFVAAQTQWLWLVRAAIILGAIGLLTGAVDFLLIWFGLASFPLINAVLFNLVVLGILLALRMVVAAMFTMLVGILIPLFYFVLIGLVVAFPPPMLFGISASNALLIAALILRPKFITHWVGYGAAWTAKQLRRLPALLQ